MEWLKRFKRTPSSQETGNTQSVNLSVVQALCDVQRPMLRKEDLDRLDQAHRELQDDIQSTKEQAKEITARLSSELERAKLRVNLIADSIIDPLLSVDSQGVILSINREAAKVFGYTPAQLIGKAINVIIDDNSLSHTVCSREAESYIAYLNRIRPTALSGYREIYNAYVEGAKGSVLSTRKSIKCYANNEVKLDADLYVNIFNIDCDASENVVFLFVFRTKTEILEREKIESLTAFQLTLLRALPEPLFYKDAEGRYVGCNLAFARLVNSKEADVIGKTHNDFFMSETAHSLNTIEEEFRRANTPISKSSKVIIRALGSTQPKEMLLHTVSLLDSKGFRGTISTLVDLTNVLEMKRFKEALLNSIPVASYYLDKNLRYSNCNERYCKLVGRAREAVIGRSREEILAASESESGVLLEFYKQKDFEILKNSSSIQVYESAVYNTVRKELVHLVVCRSVIKSIEGSFDGIVAVLIDISEFFQNYKFYQNLVENLPIPVYHKDKDSVYTACNELYYKWFGLMRVEIVGRTFKDVIAYIKSLPHSDYRRDILLAKLPEYEQLLNTLEADEVELLSGSTSTGVKCVETTLWNFQYNELRHVRIYKRALFGDKGCEGIVGSIIDLGKQSCESIL